MIDLASAVTAKERVVLTMIARGGSNESIARTFDVSVQCVARTVSLLMAKMHAGNRAELVARAYVHRILDASAWPPEPAT